MVQLLELSDAVRPTYICCKILAICPYTIRGRGEGRKLVFLKRDIAIVILQLLLAVNVCYSSFNFFSFFREGAIVDKIAFIFQNVANCLALLTNMMIFHVYRNDIVEILSQADEIDMSLNTIGCSVNYNSVYKQGIVSLVTSYCLGFVLFLGDMYNMDSSIIFQYNLPVFLGITTRNMLYTFLFSTKLKYSLINEKLQTVIHTSQPHISTIENDSLLVSGRQSNQRNKELAILLHNIVNIHGKLSIHCHQINYVFHFNLLLHISACFAETVAAGYMLMVIKQDTFLLNLLLTYWTLYNIFVIVYMVYYFNDISSEALKTIQLMNNFRYSSLCTDDISPLMSVHMLRVKHQQVTFTACGLFPIDNALLYAMTAGLATYVIILYQFKF